MNKQAIEKEVLDIANQSLIQWLSKFNDISVSIDPLSINRNDDKTNYFSEIEFNFWKGTVLETCFSVIIFMNGKQYMSIDEIKAFIAKEIDINYAECKVIHF